MKVLKGVKENIVRREIRNGTQMEFLEVKYIIYELDRTNSRWDNSEEKTSVYQYTVIEMI